VKAELSEWRELAPGIRHFVFEVRGVESFGFTPGQFVSLKAGIDGKEITRAYSLASRPSGNTFELCLNLVQDGHFSPFLFGMRIGDSVDLEGPLGYFVLRPATGNLVMVATGTGIAPFRGMIPEALEGLRDRKVTLIFGTRREETILYREEWEALARAHSNLFFWPTLSRSGENWRGRTGYVQTHLAEALEGRADGQIYVCGLKAMVDEVRALAKGLGMDRKQIVYEKYD